MKAVIMVGGKGTRIRSIAKDIPKAMIPVLKRPILAHQIDSLKNSGFRDIILVTGYLKDPIIEYFGDGSAFGVNIDYFNEESPLGTAGALAQIGDELKDDFVLLMGDVMLSVDFERFMRAHKAAGAWVTLFTHPNAHPQDSYLIVTDEVGKLKDFTMDKCGVGRVPGRFLRPDGGKIGQKLSIAKTPEDLLKSPDVTPSAQLVTDFINAKEEKDLLFHNQVSAGIYGMSPKAIKLIKETAKKNGAPMVDLDREVVRPLIKEKKVYAYKSTEYVKDMGTPERYEEVTRDVKSGLVESRNLKNKQPCVFLDRDGTINEEVGFLTDPKDLRLIPQAAEALRKLNKSRFLAVVITNQPVVARGWVSFKGLDDIFKTLEMRLALDGAYLDGIYFCPHHEKSGFEGEVKELKFDCYCRKPKPGMILKAAEDLNIDLEHSYMVGDMSFDVLCGQNAGIKPIALETGYNLNDGFFEVKADMTLPNILDAVDWILENDHRKD